MTGPLVVPVYQDHAEGYLWTCPRCRTPQAIQTDRKKDLPLCCSQCARKVVGKVRS